MATLKVSCRYQHLPSLNNCKPNNWVSLDFLNKSWDILTNVEAPSISGFLACLEQPEQLIVIVILQWTVVGNKILFLTIEACTLKANPDDIKSKYLMKKCFSSQTSILSHLMIQILRTWYTPGGFVWGDRPFYLVKWPQEKWACDFHDDATPLSFQLQVTEAIF